MQERAVSSQDHMVTSASSVSCPVNHVAHTSWQMKHDSVNIRFLSAVKMTPWLIQQPRSFATCRLLTAICSSYLRSLTSSGVLKGLFHKYMIFITGTATSR